MYILTMLQIESCNGVKDLCISVACCCWVTASCFSSRYINCLQAWHLFAGVLYASKETHYSVFKAGKMYRMQTEAVNTLPTGEIDYEHFRQRLRANNDKPAIINVNIGTTVKGAVDDLDRILEVLTEEGFDEDRFYIHCDGALFGLMVSVHAAGTQLLHPDGSYVCIASIAICAHPHACLPHISSTVLHLFCSGMAQPGMAGAAALPCSVGPFAADKAEAQECTQPELPFELPCYEHPLVCRQCTFCTCHALVG